MAALALISCCGLVICDAAEVLDKVVASIGLRAITARDVDQEYRFERFLDGQWPPPPPNPAMLTSVRDRLTDQWLLLAQENPGPAEKAACEKAAVERLDTVRKEFAHPQEFQRAIQELGMTETEVVARVAKQEQMLRLIDERLRPAAAPTDEEVADYYRTSFVPAFQKKNGGAPAPPFTDVSSQIREILTQGRINVLLDQWIEELRPGASVQVHSF